MRVSFLATALAVFLLGCSHRDPIDRLVAEVSNEGPTFYMFAPVQLPATASPKELISALTVRGEFGSRQITSTSIKILQIRAVHIGPDSQDYTAVLLDTNLGQKIVLLQPQSLNGKWRGWYYKVYDAK